MRFTQLFEASATGNLELYLGKCLLNGRHEMYEAVAAKLKSISGVEAVKIRDVLDLQNNQILISAVRGDNFIYHYSNISIKFTYQGVNGNMYNKGNDWVITLTEKQDPAYADPDDWKEHISYCDSFEDIEPELKNLIKQISDKD